MGKLSKKQLMLWTGVLVLFLSLLAMMFVGAKYVTKITGSSTDITVSSTSRTVLFADGAFIINEKFSDHGSNVSNHGAVVAMYDPLSTTNTYDFESVSEVPWASHMSDITAVSIGDNISAVSTAYWFDGASACTSVNFQNLGSSGLANMASTFEGCTNLGLITWPTGLNTSAVTDMSNLFSGCSNMSAIDVTVLNTSSVENMSGMFKNCSNVETLAVDSFTTNNVTDMSSMFEGCVKLKGNSASATSFDLSNFVTTNVENMSAMFSGDSTLSAINLTSFNTEQVEDMSGMFNGCSGLLGIDVSGFNTGLVQSTSGMFNGCSGLSELDVTNFDVSNVTDMSSMFAGCSNISTLDLKQFETASATTMVSMFDNCTSLGSIYVGEATFDTSKLSPATQDMFVNCNALEGGAGTRHDSVATTPDSSIYAKIDGGSMDPGYFIGPAPQLYYGVKQVGGEKVLYLSPTQTTNADTRNDEALGPGGPERCAWYADKATITTVVIEGSKNIEPSNLTGWFSDMTLCNGISNLTHIDTSEVTDMSELFAGCSALTSLDLSQFDTAAVTDMSSMFADCSSLTQLNTSEFDTSSVESMASMFAGCEGLGTLNLNFDTSSVTDTSYMFSGCEDLTSLTLGSSFDTSNSETMNNMFEYCSSLTEISGTGLNTASATTLESMFEGCEALASLDTTNFNTSNALNLKSMFNGCSTISTINLAAFDTSNVTDFSYMFNECENLQTLDVSDLDFSSAETLELMFNGCSNVQALNFNNNIDTTSVANMNSMFKGCEAATTINVSGFDMETVENMNSMFEDCHAVTILNTSGFTTTSATEMHNMFKNCQTIQALDLSNFNTSEVSNLGSMFAGCSNLQSLDLTSFVTTNVTDMGDMFNGCRALDDVDVSSFNTSLVQDMGAMFKDCATLTILDISEFDTSSVTNTSGMFDGCRNIETIVASSDFDISGLATAQSMNMFTNCSTKLHGDQGTYWSDDKETDKTYAHLDGGTANPGYFSQGVTPVVADLYYGINGGTLYLSPDKDETLAPNPAPKATTATQASDCSWDGDREDITTVQIIAGSSSNANITPQSMAYWFSGMENLTTINGLNNLNTASTTNMSYMFEGCVSLTVLDLTGFSSNALNNAESMFMDADSLRTIYATPSGFTTSNASGNNTFYGCSVLMGGNGSKYSESAGGMNTSLYGRLDVRGTKGFFTDPNATPVYWGIDGSTLYISPTKTSNADTPSLTLMNAQVATDVPWSSSAMLGSIQTVSVDGTSANPIYPTGMAYWFAGMTDLQTISATYFGTQNALTTEAMFSNCYALTSVPMALDTSSAVNMSHMFAGCSGLTSFDDSEVSIAAATDLSGMFSGCKFTSFTFDSWNTANVTNMSEMFKNCNKLTTLDITCFNTSSVTDMTEMFAGCSDIEKIYASNNFVTTSVETGKDADMFDGDSHLVGSYGTQYDPSYVDKTYARIDSENVPGYLTDRTAPMPLFWGISSTAENGTTLYISPSRTEQATRGNLTVLTSQTASDVPWHGQASSIQAVMVQNEVNTEIVPTSMAYWFDGMSSLTTVSNFENIYTNTVTNFDHLFNGCSELSNFDFMASFDSTAATKMDYMFSGTKPESLEINFEADNVQSMKGMFQGTGANTGFGLTIDSNFSTEAVEDMSQMFKSSTLTALNGELDFSSATNTSEMFSGCTKLTTLETENWETTNKLTNTKEMFNGCTALTELNLQGFVTSGVTDMSDMFSGCSELQTIIASNSFVTTGLSTTQTMFANCSVLKGPYHSWSASDTSSTFARIDTSDTKGYFTDSNPPVQPSAWWGISGTTLYISPFETSNAITNAPEILNGFASQDDQPWASSRTSITSIVIENPQGEAIKPISMARWFYGFTALTNVTGVSTNIDTSELTSLRNTFYGCSALEKLDLENFVTTNKLTTTYSMLNGCSKLQTIDLRNFDTSGVTAMDYMFQNCTTLSAIYVTEGKFVKTSLQTSSYMFAYDTTLQGGNGTKYKTSVTAANQNGTYALVDKKGQEGYLTDVNRQTYFYGISSDNTQLYISPVKTSLANIANNVITDGQVVEYTDIPWYKSSGASITKVTIQGSIRPKSIKYWFYKCTKLTTITNIGNIDTSECTSLQGLFYQCSSLTSLDLSGFNTVNVTDMTTTFSGCTSLTTIKADDSFVITNVTIGSNTFSNCNSLQGGSKTRYDSEPTQNRDKYTYAHIDGGTSNPGYFTRK